MARLPLEGIRIIDSTYVFALPYAGGLLADFGAEVIKVEGPGRPDVTRTGGYAGAFPENDLGEDWWNRPSTYNLIHRGKQSITLDMTDSRGRDYFRDLIKVSDVVMENFTPRVMDRFGLNYESLRAYKPDLIMVSNTGYGHSGPWSNFGAMASALEPTHGTGAFMGYMEKGPDGRLSEGQVPNKMGNSYSDFLASWTALGSLMAALLRRAKTGQGQWIDLAMYQTGVTVIGPGLLDYAYNGRRTLRIGNRHLVWSPHGVYPGQGYDQWVAIAARDDNDWRAICQTIGQPELLSDPRFADSIDRRQHQEELDEIISAWTCQRTAYQAMDILQEAGVPSGAVLNAKQALVDPQYLDRKFFEPVHNPPEVGLRPKGYVGRAWKFSASETGIKGPAPRLGEANDYVLRELLGVNREKMDRLMEDWIIGNIPEGGGAPGQVPLIEQVELGWIAEFEADYLERLPPV